MILIINDDKTIRDALSMLLRHAGHEALQAATPGEALDIIRRDIPGAILMDMNYGGSTTGRDGLELLQKVKVLAPATPVILITAWGSIPLAVEGMRLGAFDFLTKPFDSRLLIQRINTALQLSGGAAGSAASGAFDRGGIVGSNPALLDVLATVERIAPTDASVLITGENGTGKELIAQAIHNNSPRRSRPFVMVNLGGVSQSLFESEMFGHAKGAFTGAVANREGRFQAADGGTIFLDEIGDLDLTCQVKMLRVLQQHQFEPLGVTRPVKVDIRVVCATNADLPAMLREHTFREDLYYRINTITLHLPPLRERRDDIPALARHFASLHPERGHVAISSDAMETLCRLPYPGNIRQLKNIIDRAILVSGSNEITKGDLDIRDASREPTDAPATTSTLEEMERKAITDALGKHGGNLSRAAAELGITRQSLYRRMEKHGIAP